jgi:DNA mismatch repair protein MutH
MKAAKAKGIVLDQANISLPEWRRRVENPLLWKPSQVEKVIEVLKRIGI